MNVIILYLFFQISDTLKNIIVWSFNGGIINYERADSALVINPGYIKRAWFKYETVSFNFFPLISYIPPYVNSGGALFEGGVQVANLRKDMGFPYDNPYDPDHQPPYAVPDPLYYDFATRNADDSIRFVPNIGDAPVVRTVNNNDNYMDYCLFWAIQQIKNNVNSLEFDEISCAYDISFSGVTGKENPNEGYDDYTMGTANLATRISVIYYNDFDSIRWEYPQSFSSSNETLSYLAFDDDFNTYWYSQVSDSHYIEIDFKRLRRVAQIYLYLNSQNIIQNFNIKYLGEDSLWHDFNPPINVLNNTDTILSFLVKPALCYKVRLKSNDSQIYLNEMQVFGYGFRQYLLKKYIDSLGWSYDDIRWQTEKLVDLSDTLQCPDGTMRLFDYQKYLEYHEWTGNPFGGPVDTTNLLNPYNPFFLEHLPGKYLKHVFLFYADDSLMIDSLIKIRKRSFDYKRTKYFWDYITLKVKEFANSIGRQVFVTYNGSFSPLTEKADYLICPIAANGKNLPTYPAPSPTDSLKTHLRGNITYINSWIYSKRFVFNYLDTILPVVAFLDFGHSGNPFMHIGGIDEPADERAEYLKIFVPEMYSVGVRFAFPVVCGGEVAFFDTLSDGRRLIDIIKNLADFFNNNREIYREFDLNPDVDSVKVNGIIPFNGVEEYIGIIRKPLPVNESKVSISYTDSKDGLKSYLHIINHNWDSLAHRIIYQYNIPVEIPVKDSVINLYIISPDTTDTIFPSYNYSSLKVNLSIPEIKYYSIIVTEFSETNVREEVREISTPGLYLNLFPKKQGLLILYGIPFKTDVEILIYNISGRRISEILSKTLNSGNYKILWKGYKNLPPGLYFIELKAGDILTKKVIKID